jgi:hypothetical protein
MSGIKRFIDDYFRPPPEPWQRRGLERQIFFTIIWNYFILSCLIGWVLFCVVRFFR